MLKKIAVAAAIALCSTASFAGKFGHPYLESGTELSIVSPHVVYVCSYVDGAVRPTIDNQDWQCDEYPEAGGIREPLVVVVPDYEDFDGSPVSVIGARAVFYSQPCEAEVVDTERRDGRCGKLTQLVEMVN